MCKKQTLITFVAQIRKLRSGGRGMRRGPKKDSRRLRSKVCITTWKEGLRWLSVPQKCLTFKESKLDANALLAKQLPNWSYSQISNFTTFWSQTASNNLVWCTVIESHRKSLIQHCKRSELRLHFEWTNVN